MSFLYFHPTESNNKPDLKKIGLDYIYDNSPVEIECQQLIGLGPDSQRGWIIGRPMDCRQVIYVADMQDWRCIAGRWIGWFKSIEPKPSMFQRDHLLDGYDWTDWKGNVWKIPVARRYQIVDNEISHYTAVPTYSGINSDGQFVLQGVQTKYEKLWKLACQCEYNRVSAIAAAQLAGSTSYSYEVGDMHDVLNIVVGTNYRLSSYEIGLMGIATDSTAIDLMRLVTDQPALEELQKKILRDTGNG